MIEHPDHQARTPTRRSRRRNDRRARGGAPRDRRRQQRRRRRSLPRPSRSRFRRRSARTSTSCSAGSSSAGPRSTRCGARRWPSSSRRDSALRCRTTAGRRAHACSSCTSASDSARAGGVASRGETGAGRERQALIAAGMPRWTAFAARLAHGAAEAGSARSARTACASSWPSTARSPADLARLRTAAGGRAAGRAVLPRPARGERAQPALPRSRHAAARRAPLPLHRRSARSPPLGRARSRSPLSALSCPPRSRESASCDRPSTATELLPDAHDQARRGWRTARPGRRGLHRRPSALPPGDGDGDHRQQRAGHVRRVRRRRHGRTADDGARSW